jgi:hypothetical protein
VGLTRQVLGSGGFGRGPCLPKAGIRFGRCAFARWRRIDKSFLLENLEKEKEKRFAGK